MKKIIGGMKLIKYKKYFNIKFFLYGFVVIGFYNTIKSCSKDTTLEADIEEVTIQPDNFKFGYNLNNFKVVNDTVKSGDSFGVLLEKHHLFYPQIHHIAEKTKEVFDVESDANICAAWGVVDMYRCCVQILIPGYG